MTDCKTTDLSNVTLAVLAGGRGERMGRPKAWLKLEQRPILDWLLGRMHWPGPTMLVTAPAVVHPPGWKLFDQEVVDPVDGMGPLRGILTGLGQLRTPMAAFVTVDMPGVERGALEWLVEAMGNRPGCRGVMCGVSGGGERRVEPFPSVFRADAAEIIGERVAAGRLSLQGLCLDPRFCAVDAPSDWAPTMWANLNTPGDVAAFEAQMAARRVEGGE